MIVGNKKTSKQHQLFIIFNYVDKHEANREGNHLLLKLCPNFFFYSFETQQQKKRIKASGKIRILDESIRR